MIGIKSMNYRSIWRPRVHLILYSCRLDIHFICAWLGWLSLIYHTNWESAELMLKYKSIQSHHQRSLSEEPEIRDPALACRSVWETQFRLMLTLDQFVTNYRIKRHLFWVGLLGSLSLILCHQTSWMLFILASVNWMTRTCFVSYILVKIPRLAR